ELGAQTRALAGLGIVPPAPRPAAGTERVIETLYTAPDQLAARLAETAGGDVMGAVQLRRALDHILVSWSRAEQETAWRNLAAAIVATTPPLHVPLGRQIASALHAPW